MKKTRRLQTQGEGPRMLALEPQMNLTLSRERPGHREQETENLNTVNTDVVL